MTLSNKQDIDDLIEQILSMVWNDGAELAGGAYLNAPHYGLVVAVPKLKQALYQSIAAEAVEYPVTTRGLDPPITVDVMKAIPLSKLKELFGVAE